MGVQCTFTMSSDLLISLAVIGCLFGAQAAAPPAIADIVNAASFKSAYLGSGGLATIFGTNLKGDDSQQQCSGTLSASGFTTTACGTKVLQNGQEVPIIYVGRNPATGQDQINFQLRHGAGTYVFQVLRSSDGQTSASKSFDVLAAAPAPFVWSSASGVGYPAALFTDYSTVAPNNAAIPGRSIISFYITGAGEPSDGTVIPVGQPAPTNRLVLIPHPIICLLNDQTKAWQASDDSNILFAGLAPGLVIQQLNWAVPADTLAGARYLKICALSAGACSDPITLPVTRTGVYVAGNVQTIEKDFGSVTGNTTQPDGSQAPFVVNASGNFLADVAKGANKVALLGNGVFYNWRNTVSVNGPTQIGTVQMFPVYTDNTSLWDYHPEINVSSTQSNPEWIVWTKGSKGMDLLDAIKWQNNYQISRGGCRVTTTMRILDDDLPRSVYVSPSDATPDRMAAIRAAYDDLNTRARAAGLGTDLLRLTTTAPGPNDHVYTVHFQQPPVSTFIAAFAMGNHGIPCSTWYDGDLYFGPGATVTSDALRINAGHEAGHAVGFGISNAHLPGTEDLMYFAALGAKTPVFSAFEMKGITVLYWLKAGTDLTKYDNLPK